jgi:hypothetical protein
VSNLPAKAESKLPAPHPALVRAAVSPTAIVATAAGAGIGLLAHSIPLAIALAVVGWTIRMIVAFIVQRRKERAAAPHPAQLDPWSVPEPWRAVVQQASATQTRFDQVVGGWPEGPMRDRVLSLRPTFYKEFAAVGAITSHGAAMNGWTGAATPLGGAPTAQSLTQELAQTQAERVALGDRAPGRAEELSRREEAIAAQLRAVHAAQQASESVHDRLRVIVARLDEAVTHLLTLSIEAGDGGGLDQVSGVLTSLDDELAALQAGVAETRTPPDSLTP